jgi:hypothetical protein
MSLPVCRHLTIGSRLKSKESGLFFFGELFAERIYYARSPGGPIMPHMPDVPDSVTVLESQRAGLLRKIFELGDVRPGSITTTTGRCGNPGCHCHRPNHPGHGPNFRLTYKEKGKTVTESLASPAARRKTGREIEEYRRWQQLSREFVDVNARLCRLRATEEQELTAAKKNCGNHPTGSWPRNRASATAGFLRTAQERWPGFRSGGDGDSFWHAPGRSRRLEPRAAV